MNKKFTKLIAALALLVFIMPSMVMWGQTRGAASFEPSDFSGQGTSGSGSEISATIDGVTFACDKGYGTTQIRCYSGGTITISSSNTITAISFTYSGSYTGGMETSYSNLSTTSWTKNLTSQARITACTVTYGGSNPSITLSESGSLNIGNYAVGAEISRTFTVSQSNLSENITLTATHGGTFTPSSIEYGAGPTEVTWTFTPQEAGQFTSEITATSSGTSATFTYLGYAYTPHNVNIASMEHGTVTANPNSTFYWELVTLIVTPDNGYVLDELTVVDADDNPVTITNNSFHMPDSDVTVSATFVEVAPATTVIDVLNRDLTGVTGSSYTSWSGKTSNSDAVYAGNSAGGNSSIQLRSDNSSSGIVTTASGGKVRKVAVNWYSSTATGRTLNVYGKNSAYSAATDLYDSNTQGTLLGTIVKGTSTELNISGDYEYIGMRSSSGAMYLTEIQITWDAATPLVAKPTFSPEGGTYPSAQNVTIACETGNTTIYYTTDGTEPTSGSTQYTEPISVTQTTTIKAIAYDNDNNASSVATATYTIVTPLTTIPQIFARATEVGSTQTDVYVTFDNWKVVGKSYSNAYVSDGQYGLNLYTNGIDFASGDQLSGTVATKVQLYTGGAELIGLTTSTPGLTVTHNQTFEPYAISLADLVGQGIYFGSYVDLGNLTYDGSKFTDGNDHEINPNNSFFIQNYPTLVEGKTYRVKGVFIRYNNTTERIAPVYASDFTEFSGPSIEATPSPFTAPSYVVGTAEPEYETLIVNGSNLTANISLSLGANSNFEMSTDLDTWSSSLTLTQANGSVTNAEVAIRLKAGLAKGNYNGTVTLSSTDAQNVEVSLSGTVTGQIFDIVLIQPETGGTIAADLATAEEGDMVTLTATPAAAYNFGSWVVKDDEENPIEVTGNQFEMPMSDVSVTATFTLKDTYAITCAVTPDGAALMEASPASAYEGQTVTLSYVAETGYSLTEIVITNTSDGSATNITPIASGDDYTFNMPGYAVTATATFISENFNGSFILYEEELVEGDYLIVYDGGAMKNTISSKRFDYVGVTESENNLITNPSNNIVWHIAPSETTGYWTLYNAKVGQYAGSAGTNSDMSLESSATEDKALWSASGSGTYDFRNKVNEGNSTRYLRRNGSYGFANYSTSTGGALTLYKLIPNVAPAWAPEFPTSAEIITSTPYELTVSDFVTGIPTPSISITTSVSSSLYEFEDGEFMFQPSEAGTFVFTFTATNTEGSVAATLTITVNEPAQLQYVYSSNGTLGTPQSITQGQSINSLAAGANLNDDFVFVGWTTDPNDVEHILEAGSSYTVNEATTFYAVYSRTVNVAKEKVVVLDGEASGLTGSAQTNLTLSENGFTYYASSAKYQGLGSGAENNVSSGRTILIGKGGAYLYNTTAFDQGITKFEIYANAGASGSVSVGVNFSASTISQYNAAAENTWIATLSTRDYVYDASEALPQGAKYFWYQVTNANNSQVQFRITYTATESATTYYTRVFLNETAEGNLAIIGPSIIPSGSMLDMGEYTLSNNDPANLIIKDGGQLKVYATGAKDGGVQATVEKNIAKYTTNNNGWNFIASPINVNNLAPTNVANMLSNTYDLYQLNNTKWENYKDNEGHTNAHPGFGLVNGRGYLYANSEDVTLSFPGVVKPYSTEDQVEVSAGWNLIGNPYTFNVYVDQPYFTISQAQEGIAAQTTPSNENAIAPCTGILVNVEEDGCVTFSETAPSQSNNGNLNLVVAQAVSNRGSAATLDNAIVSFNEGDELEKFYFMQQNANLYIPQGAEEYAIVSSQAQGEMPVNFCANENGEYTLTVNAENVEMSYLHLIDNMTGADTDLLQTPSYTFTARTTDYKSRFRLVFASLCGDANGDNETFAFFGNGTWNIVNEGEATLQVVDMLGHILSSQTVNGNATMSTNNLAAGVYLMRLVNNDNVKTQKVIVK